MVHPWYVDFRNDRGGNKIPLKSQKIKLILDSAKEEQLQRIANSRKALLKEVEGPHFIVIFRRHTDHRY